MQILIQPLQADDLPEADRIFRLAFGTFLGLPDPLAFAGDADYVHTRWRAAPDAALGAYVDGVLIGSNFAARWGRFGFFGPLTVRPDFWDRGVARELLAATMTLFERWNTRHAGLFTFPQSTKHVGLYQRFGFWPQHLTALMSKAVPSEVSGTTNWRVLSSLAPQAREAVLADCRALTDALHDGLDVSVEIESTLAQSLGETVLIEDDAGLAAFAVCHLGGGSEAGSGTAYIKFGATRSGPNAPRDFERLLAACEALAQERGLGQVMAGVNTSRHDAYRRMLARGYRTVVQGVAMQQHNAVGHNRADCYVIDDWR
ncbi:GNAT family N-acetyltransferase [Lysobacter terrae]